MPSDTGEGSKKMKAATSWKAGILLAVVSSLAALTAAEVYFRFTSPYIIRKNTAGPVGVVVTEDNDSVLSGEYTFFMDTFRGRRLIPGSRVKRANYEGKKIEININSQGLRNEEIPAKKPDEKRLLFLGDSVTIGVDVPVEVTFPKQAERLLNPNGRDERISCINGGIEGIGTKDEIDVFEDQWLSLRPDVVIVDFFLNDGNPPDRLAAGLANPGFIRRHSVLAQTVFRAYKLRQLRHDKMEEAWMYEWMTIPPPPDWRTNRESFLKYASVAARDWGAAWEQGPWRGIEQQMKRLQTLSEQHGFKVVFVAFPVSFQVYADYLEDGPQRKLRELAGKFNFRFFDMLPVFRSHAADGRIFIDAYHLTEYGHSLAGEAQAGFLSGNTQAADNHDKPTH